MEGRHLDAAIAQLAGELFDDAPRLVHFIEDAMRPADVFAVTAAQNYTLICHWITTSGAVVQKIDLTGQRFGRLVVLKDVGRSKRGLVNWSCHCDCGSHTIVNSHNLRTGNTNSCGVCQRGRPPIVHGHCQRHSQMATWPSTYMAWCSMHQRCSNSNNRSYRYYGGRGIQVCERWTAFENFFADMGERPDGLSIDRIDHNGNYEPSKLQMDQEASTE